LESGLDAGVMAYRRLVYRRPDAHATPPDPHTHAESTSHPHTDASANAGPRPGM